MKTDVHRPTETLALKDAYKALFALCIGFFMILLDQTVVAVATPQLKEELGADMNEVVWVTSMYLLTFAVPMIVTGRLGDRFGQRRMYLIGMIIFTVASLLCGLAATPMQLIIYRAFQGLGASILVPQTMSVINRIFPRGKIGAAMGIWGAVGGIASLVGPLLGGVVVAALGWQWVFFINIPLGVISFAQVARFVPRLACTARSLDPVSVAVSMGAVFCVVFALQQGPKIGWVWWIWVLGVAGVILVAVFLAIQKQEDRRGKDPLVPLRIFRERNFAVGAFSIMTMGFTVGSMMLPIMIYLQSAKHLSVLFSSFVLIPTAVISALLSPFVGRLADRIHPRRLSVTGFSAMALSLALCSAFMRDGLSAWWLLIPMAVMGVGHGFVWSPNAAATTRDLPVELVGAGSGVYNTTRQVGSVLGAAAVGAAMQAGEQMTTLAQAMSHAVAIPAVMLFLGLLSVTQFTGGSMAGNTKADSTV